MVSSQKLIDLELALLDPKLALSHKIDLELAPSYLELASLELWLALSHKIDLELAPSHLLHKKIGVLWLAPFDLLHIKVLKSKVCSVRAMAGSQKLIDLELPPSDLGLAPSQKIIDLRLAPLHRIRVRDAAVRTLVILTK